MTDQQAPDQVPAEVGDGIALGHAGLDRLEQRLSDPAG